MRVRFWICEKIVLNSVSDPGSVRAVDPDLNWESSSLYRRAKVVDTKKEKIMKFKVQRTLGRI
jgi:hypothetical protein